MVSRIGAPINKFVRVGLDIKVCILLSKDKICPDRFTVWVEGERITIKIETTKSHTYDQWQEQVKEQTKVWKSKVNHVARTVAESLQKGETSISSKKISQINSEIFVSANTSIEVEAKVNPQPKVMV